MRFKAAPVPKLPVKQPPSAAAPSGDGTPDFGVPQPDAREPIIACLDWHNTLDIAIEPDGAPKDWLFRTLAKLYRNHFPIQFRIVSCCQARETRESTLRLATQFTRVCNDSIDGLGTPPFGDVVLTWKRVGPSGKAAALAQLGTSVIIDDNNATLRECRIAGALGICVERRRSTRRWTSSTSISTNTDASSVLPEYSTRQSTLKKLVTAPTLQGAAADFYADLALPEAAAQAQQRHRFPTPVKCTGFQHRLYYKFQGPQLEARCVSIREPGLV